MQVDVNGTRLWFDVDGPALVPHGSTMTGRPTVVLLHGGPGSYDHSYFKPDFTALTTHAQIVYLDLRDHGRSARQVPADWTFEVCADDVRAVCDAIGIAAPIVYGHSMGGFIAMLYAARHPDHAGGLVLQSTCARFDLERLVEGVRDVAGDDVAAIARRDYGGDPVSDVLRARPVAPEVLPLHGRVGGHQHLASVGAAPDPYQRGVVARPQQHVRALGEQRRDGVDESELAQCCQVCARSGALQAARLRV